MLLILTAVALGLSATAPVARKCDPQSNELAVDLDKSTIRWRGTKFWGMGKHEGTVRLKAGAFCVKQGQVLHGWFEADMRSIDITDIPASEPEPRRRLREHLLSEDFFAVEKHPVSRFIVREVQHERDHLYRVSGDLTVRGQTRPLTFYARGWSVTDQELRAEAGFKIDRHQFGVSYRGSTIKDDLVDDDIWLELTIEARASRRAATRGDSAGFPRSNPGRGVR
jgi:polyisoprenoid-binding protein YceI